MDPRVERSRAKIFEAVLEEMGSSGYASMTIEGIAARAGVGKTTIYRHWPSKAALVIEAVHDQKAEIPAVDNGNLRDDLVQMLSFLADRLVHGGMSRLLPAMISAAEVDPELRALHHGFVQERRRPLWDVLERAVERGELGDDVDIQLAADLLSGPLFFRRFITREEITPQLVEQLVDALLPRLGTLCQPPGGRGRNHGGTRAARHGGRRRARHGNMRHDPPPQDPT